MYSQFLCLSGMFYWQVASPCLWHFSYNHSDTLTYSEIPKDLQPKRSDVGGTSTGNFCTFLLTTHLVTVLPGGMELWNSGKEDF